MILTCPACDTKYVVKDDAIPPDGRQVRCASCKHSWHQDPERSRNRPLQRTLTSAVPPPSPESFEEPSRSATGCRGEGLVADEPRPLDDGGHLPGAKLAESPLWTPCQPFVLPADVSWKKPIDS